MTQIEDKGQEGHISITGLKQMLDNIWTVELIKGEQESGLTLSTSTEE